MPGRKDRLAVVYYTVVGCTGAGGPVCGRAPRLFGNLEKTMQDRQWETVHPYIMRWARWRFNDQDDQRESRVLGVALLGAVLGDQLWPNEALGGRESDRWPAIRRSRSGPAQARQF